MPWDQIHCDEARNPCLSFQPNDTAALQNHNNQKPANRNVQNHHNEFIRMQTKICGYVSKTPVPEVDERMKYP